MTVKCLCEKGSSGNAMQLSELKSEIEEIISEYGDLEVSVFEYDDRWGQMRDYEPSLEVGEQSIGRGKINTIARIMKGMGL